ncbi:MAG: radical SAM protein [Ruminococcaceae bacterium]|nr:radical SAM protein [Oscillospiraceae bacterium]
MTDIEKCILCPRNCKVNRNNLKGFCGAGNSVKIARAALHFWEEPIISGKNGSGTIFFCHCNLMCAYCQNKKISSGGFGKNISTSGLSKIFLMLQDMGAHNINLVTPTPYIPFIIEAIDSIKPHLNIPVVYNCGGYEKPEIISLLNNYVDIYLTDFKYYDKALAKKYSLAENYPDFALASLEKMVETKGAPVIENGLMKKGVIVRHLVLPSHRNDSIAILNLLKENFDTDRFILSLMSQYFPPENLDNFPEINRKITTFEYNSVVNHALNIGFSNAYIQEKSSADKIYVPDFDLSGVDLIE